MLVAQREAAYRLVHSGAGVLCSPPCEPTALVAAIVDAHGDGKRRAALRSSVVLREAGGVGKAASLVCVFLKRGNNLEQ